MTNICVTVRPKLDPVPSDLVFRPQSRIPYRARIRSNKATPLLAALLLVYKSLASNKKVAFSKAQRKAKDREQRFSAENGNFKRGGKLTGDISRFFGKKLWEIGLMRHFLPAKAVPWGDRRCDQKRARKLLK